MTRELWILVASIIFGIVHIVLASHAQSFQRGYLWTAGARDAPVQPLTGIAGRLARASSNYLETFPLFAAAILLVYSQGISNDLTLYSAYFYLGARIAYLISYAAGTFLIRSLIWNVSTLSILTLLSALVSG